MENKRWANGEVDFRTRCGLRLGGGQEKWSAKGEVDGRTSGGQTVRWRRGQEVGKR